MLVETFGTFPIGVSTNVYVNNVAQITGFSSDSKTTTIKKGELIYVTHLGSSSNEFGLIFTTISHG